MQCCDKTNVGRPVLYILSETAPPAGYVTGRACYGRASSMCHEVMRLCTALRSMYSSGF